MAASASGILDPGRRFFDYRKLRTGVQHDFSGSADGGVLPGAVYLHVCVSCAGQIRKYGFANNQKCIFDEHHAISQNDSDDYSLCHSAPRIYLFHAGGADFPAVRSFRSGMAVGQTV